MNSATTGVPSQSRGWLRSPPGVPTTAVSLGEHGARSLLMETYDIVAFLLRLLVNPRPHAGGSTPLDGQATHPLLTGSYQTRVHQPVESAVLLWVLSPSPAFSIFLDPSQAKFASARDPFLLSDVGQDGVTVPSSST